jgi:hypothetical protein
MVQDANVPEPPIKSTPTVKLFEENAVIGPSIKFVGVADEATLTRVPTANAVAVAAKFVVKTLEPVATVVEVVLVRPAYPIPVGPVGPTTP